MVAIAEFILDFLEVVVTVNGRKNIGGLFSIRIKTKMLRKKWRWLQTKPWNAGQSMRLRGLDYSSYREGEQMTLT